MIETDKIYCQDCLEGLKGLPDSSIDLIVTDPPYLVQSSLVGGHSRFADTLRPIHNSLKENNLVSGINPEILPELVRVMKRINCYIWCNKAQIPGYLNFFVGELNCSFDVILWWKTNAPPTYHNKYLSDKEYCLYFRKGGYCQPVSYEKAKTVYFQPGDVVLDPFLGSGTTAVACMELGRKYLEYEISRKYFETAHQRIQDTRSRITMQIQ